MWTISQRNTEWCRIAGGARLWMEGGGRRWAGILRAVGSSLSPSRGRARTISSAGHIRRDAWRAHPEAARLQGLSDRRGSGIERSRTRRTLGDGPPGRTSRGCPGPEHRHALLLPRAGALIRAKLRIRGRALTRTIRKGIVRSSAKVTVAGGGQAPHSAEGTQFVSTTIGCRLARFRELRGTGR